MCQSLVLVRIGYGDIIMGDTTRPRLFRAHIELRELHTQSRLLPVHIGYTDQIMVDACRTPEDFSSTHFYTPCDFLKSVFVFQPHV